MTPKGNACADAECPNYYRIKELECALNALRSRADRAAKLLADGRCDKYPGGERCGRKIGHEGGCVWERGD